MKHAIATLILTAPILAQGATVVPSATASAEGDAMVGLSGVGFSAVQQIVIDQSHLVPMVGRSITVLQVRRDGLASQSFGSGVAHLAVRLGESPNAPESVSTQFTNNIQSPLQVFSGTVGIPASTPPTTPPAPWDAANSVTIVFSPPFFYGGGHLCIELVGTVTGGNWWWPVDGAMDSAIGAVTRVGTACGPWALQSGQVAAVGERDLVPGETALFAYRGTPGSAAFMALGVAPFPQPIDLAFVGAPGCSWWVDPIALLPTVVSSAVPQPGVGGFANAKLQLPAGPSLLGGAFTVQWLEVSTALVASEALACQLSSSLPSLGMAMISQEAGDPSPSVHFTTAPVMRFQWQ